MGRLAGKIALITGATSGIGHASARLFASEGAHVIAVGRDAERGEALAAEIEKKYAGQVRFVRADVTDADDVARLLAIVQEELGRLDILFNNAGIFVTRAIDEIDDGYDGGVFAAPAKGKGSDPEHGFDRRSSLSYRGQQDVPLRFVEGGVDPVHEALCAELRA